MKKVDIVSSRYSLPRALCGLVILLMGMFTTLPIYAQTYEGNNSSSERVIIEVGSNGRAVVAWYPKLTGNVSIREIWMTSPEVNGFRLVAPDNSLLKKAGEIVKYTRISSKSTSMHCSAGCAMTMPNLIGKLN